MIHYQLRCGAAHEFDGWFPGSAAFDAQAAAALIACPECGDRRVRRALMAPALPRPGRHDSVARGDTAQAAGASPGAPEAVKPSSGAPAAAAADSAAPGRPAGMAATLPDHLRAALQRLRTEVEQRCDYVGGEFAAEARRIHEGERPPRQIYGEATPAEAEALADDGIEVSRIPWLPRADA